MSNPMTPAMTPANQPRHWLTLDGYVAHTGKSERTVRRWLAEGRLPDARLIDGAWTIPADATPGDPQPKAMTPDTTPDTGGVLVQLPMTPAMTPANPLGRLVTLEDAAQQLGTTIGGIRRLGDAGAFTIGTFGPNGSLRVYLP